MATTPIYVALHNINLGDPIDAGMVSLQEWPKDKIPRGAISQLEDLEGRRPRTSIIEGEAILEAKLLAPGAIADPIVGIPPSMRLVTIKVDAETSAAGLLSPGDRVDIQLYVKRDPRNNIGEPMTKVILQNIRVYAVDQAVQRSAEGEDARTVAKTISLLLDPEQAARLNLAEKVGEISLIPRNPDDDATVASVEVSLGDLMGDSSGRSSREKEQNRKEEEESADDGRGLMRAIQQAIPEPPPIPPFKMEIVLADQVTVMEFDAETGEPIRPDPEAAGAFAPGRGPGSVLGAPTAAQPAPAPGGTFDDMGGLEDFPIDLEDLE